MRKLSDECEGGELNPRTPARNDLESFAVDHLATLAQDIICAKMVKVFEFFESYSVPVLREKILGTKQNF